MGGRLPPVPETVHPAHQRVLDTAERKGIHLEIITFSESPHTAAEAAAAVGDDRVLAGTGQRVDPEAFTHGSAAQRQYWFEQGFANPTLATCNTFAT